MLYTYQPNLEAHQLCIYRNRGPIAMRLLNLRTMKLKVFADPEFAPPYPILSHTWSTNEDAPELVFDEWDPDVARSLKEEMAIDAATDAYDFLPETRKKIIGFTKKALAFGLEYGWIDTLCIDSKVQTSRRWWVVR